MMHELAHLVDHKGKVKTSEREVLEGTRNVTIRCGIRKRITVGSNKFLSIDCRRRVWFGRVYVSLL